MVKPLIELNWMDNSKTMACKATVIALELSLRKSFFFLMWWDTLEISNKRRTIDQVNQCTFEGRFGWVLLPTYSLSYYHGPVRLRKCADPDLSKTRRFYSFVEFIDHLNLSWIDNINHQSAVDMLVWAQVPVVPVFMEAPLLSNLEIFL